MRRNAHCPREPVPKRLVRRIGVAGKERTCSAQAEKLGEHDLLAARRRRARRRVRHGHARRCTPSPQTLVVGCISILRRLLVRVWRITWSMWLCRGHGRRCLSIPLLVLCGLKLWPEARSRRVLVESTGIVRRRCRTSLASSQSLRCSPVLSDGVRASLGRHLSSLWRFVVSLSLGFRLPLCSGFFFVVRVVHLLRWEFLVVDPRSVVSLGIKLFRFDKTCCL